MSFWDLPSKYGDTPCVHHEGGEISYGELALLADSLFRGKARGVVFILCNRNVETITGYLGALRKGVVPLMLPHDLGDTALEEYLLVYRPSYIWMAAARASSLADRHPAQLVQVQNSFALVQFAWPDPVVEPHPDLALLMPTSGSTGDPKLVRLSYRNIQANAVSIAGYLSINATDVAITNLPLNYSYGLSILNSHLLVGAQLVVSECNVLDRGYWDLVRAKSVTNISGVPFSYAMLQKLRFERLDLPSLRFMTQAGGHMAPETTRYFVEVCRAKGIDFFTMYGQTEATARIAYVPPGRALEKLGSVGVPIPGGRVEIVTSPAVEPGSSAGELVYYGENVSMGYASCREDLARGDDNQGRLCTGDLALVDDEGFITIVGRLRRFAKIYGHNVNLDQVEHILKTAGVEAMVTALDDRLLIHVIAGHEDRVAEIMRDRLTVPPTSLHVRSVEAFPVLANGKRDYQALAAFTATGSH